MRVCLVYDCLFPWTVGGAERWMRNLAEALAGRGHEVTYLTRVQWPADEPPDLPGVSVIAVAPDEPLYGPDGNRRIGQAVRFGAGVLRHLLAHGREYDVVHLASFPYFSLLAAGVARRRAGFRVIADWHEVWSDEYWREYLGGPRGAVAREIQAACARVPQQAFCFSHLHAERLRSIGLRGTPTVLRGEYVGSRDRPTPQPSSGEVVFAGRLIAEKRAPAVVGAVAHAARTAPELRGVVFGDGPQRDEVEAAIARHRAQDRVRAPGFVDADELQAAIGRALCLVLPSVREGYGMVVVEAAAAGVPSIVVRAPDNAAVELVEHGVNGFVAESASPEDLGAAILAVRDAGPALRESTADWYAAHAVELSLANSLERVLERYASARR